MGLNFTPRTWVAGEVLTAALLNAQLRDALNNLQSPWTAYTPSSAQVTLGNAVVNAYYQQIGKTIATRVRILLGSTSVVSGSTMIWSLPVPLASNYDQVAIGSAYMIDSSASATRRIGSIVVTGSGIFIVDNDTGGTVTSTAPFAWGSGDLLTYTALYEAA